MRWVALALLISGISSCRVRVDRPSPPLAWMKDVDAAAAKAAREGKPALVYVGAEWDTASKELEDRSFVDPDVRRAADGYVLLAVDATDDENPSVFGAKERFRINGTPTLIVYAPDFRTELYRANEFVRPERLASALRHAGTPSDLRELPARAWYEHERDLVEGVRDAVLAHPLLVEHDRVASLLADTAILGAEIVAYDPGGGMGWARVEPSNPEQAPSTRNAEVGIELDEHTRLGWGQFRTRHRGSDGSLRGDERLHPGIEVAWRNGVDEIRLVLLADGFRRPRSWR
jgi:hypothetical protein